MNTGTAISGSRLSVYLQLRVPLTVAVTASHGHLIAKLLVALSRSLPQLPSQREKCAA